MSEIEIVVKTKNANNALLMMLLWEMLEQPETVRKGFSNLCTPENFEWLLDEIMSFEDYILEWAQTEKKEWYEHYKSKTKVGLQGTIDG